MLNCKLQVALSVPVLPDSCCSSAFASVGFSFPNQRMVTPGGTPGTGDAGPGGQEWGLQPHPTSSFVPKVGNSYLKSLIFMVSLLTLCREGRTCQLKGRDRLLSLRVSHTWCLGRMRETGCFPTSSPVGSSHFERCTSPSQKDIADLSWDNFGGPNL